MIIVLKGEHPHAKQQAVAPVTDEKAFIDTMKYACILNCYVKRCSNLLLLSHQNARIDSGELFLAISESLEYVRLFGIKAHASCKGERQLLENVMYELIAVFGGRLTIETEAGTEYVSLMLPVGGDKI